jgi:hypothetical protein
MLMFVLMKRRVSQRQELKTARLALWAWIVAVMLLLSACTESAPSPPVHERTTPPIGTERQPEEILPEPEAVGPMLAGSRVLRPMIRC